MKSQEKVKREAEKIVEAIINLVRLEDGTFDVLELCSMGNEIYATPLDFWEDCTGEIGQVSYPESNLWPRLMATAFNDAFKREVKANHVRVNGQVHIGTPDLATN